MEISNLKIEVKQKAMTLLQMKKEISLAISKIFLLEEVQPLVKKLQQLDYQLSELEISLSQSGNATVNIGGENSSEEDLLNDSLSTHEKLRRVQAKTLARKLYRIYHDDYSDTNRLPWVSFSSVRDLAKSGEIEIISYIRLQHQLDHEDYLSLSQLSEMLNVRISRLKATPSYFLARRLISSDRTIDVEIRRILQKKIFDLEFKIANFYA